nr:DNA cytosine methyltransferase [Bacilli bacterium]
MISKKFTVIDLFCGCGGFSKGFEQAGFNVKLGIDSWMDAIVTYQNNFPAAKTINEDISQISGQQILNSLNMEAGEIDVVIGGPPCQGFSVSGKRMIDDPRNKLYKTFVDIVSYIKPKMFVMENVPGLMRLFGGAVKDSVLQDFSSLGYSVELKLLSADNYGVPQHRNRIFFVGINKDKIFQTSRFIFPIPSFGEDERLQPFVTCKDAISDLDFISDSVLGEDCIDYQISPQNDFQLKMRNDSCNLYNHVTTIHTEQTKRIIAMVPDGGNYKSLPKELWNTRKVNIAWTRMNSQRPSFTIDTGHNHHFHYLANRVPTVRESARIQSFPDTFKFIGIKTSQLKQVGNAVPPLLAEAIATEVFKTLERG